VSLDDIQAILNMRDGWKCILSAPDASLTLDYLCALNALVSRNESLAWGVLRGGAVGIAGVAYRPPVPDARQAAAELEALLAATVSDTERALDLFLWGTRAQLFWDGNKRTSLLAANKVLVAAGSGLLTINEWHIEAFNALLSAYYETGDGAALKDFLYENGIEGIE
jgi:hypothetical protein